MNAAAAYNMRQRMLSKFKKKEVFLLHNAGMKLDHMSLTCMQTPEIIPICKYCLK